MKRVFDLSIRYKLPLWGAALVLATTISVSAMLMHDAWDEMREDTLLTAKAVAHAVTGTLADALLRDDVWRAYETLIAQGPDVGGATPFDMLMLVDRTGRVFASTRPQRAPLASELAALGDTQAALAAQIDEQAGEGTRLVDLAPSDDLHYVTPIVQDGVRLGTLIASVPRTHVLPRFRSLALHSLAGALLVLCVLLPANWFWGRYMARPLLQLSDAMSRLGRRLPAVPETEAPYRYADEIGRLFHVYHQMLRELEAREALEREIVKSERLAAVGRLAAGIAHEINNPLGGMLAAVDTLRCHAVLDPLTERTVSLLERGLAQIRETVGALLVQSRVRGDALSPRDVDDVHLLVAPRVQDKRVRLAWHDALPGAVALPANLVRQVLMNLLLNAVEATGTGGHVSCRVERSPDAVHIDVRNDGRTLDEEQMTRLFEPFSPSSSSGHGLGLWVTYQIVQQLGGRIAADRVDGLTRFRVELPVQEMAT